MTLDIRETLGTHFRGVGAKVLARVEVDQARSNQHELNGTDPLKAFLGKERLERIPTQLLYLSDDEDDSINSDTLLSWYDSRLGNTRRTAEFRLYYSSNPVMEAAEEGDLAIVAQRHNEELLVIVAPAESTSASQLQWLFDVMPARRRRAQTRTFPGSTRLPELGFAARTVLEQIGIDAMATSDFDIDAVMARFGDSFPTTREFSRYARQICRAVEPLDDPDTAITAWIEQEERLFRALERRQVSKRLAIGFTDVDEFMSFSLGVQNRRKSRAGHALENHLAEIFQRHHIQFSRGAITEHRSRPDFLFPSIGCYRDKTFTENALHMLGVKTSCKDRWRQVLSEAQRIYEKHLFTLEAGITKTQTDEMAANRLHLVIPEALFESYRPDQRLQILRLKDFIELVAH